MTNFSRKMNFYGPLLLLYTTVLYDRADYWTAQFLVTILRYTLIFIPKIITKLQKLNHELSKLHGHAKEYNLQLNPSKFIAIIFSY